MKKNTIYFNGQAEPILLKRQWKEKRVEVDRGVSYIKNNNIK
jgi:hypothetical protein